MSDEHISKALGLTPLSELNDEMKSVQEVQSTEVQNIEKFEVLPTEGSDENLNDMELARQNVKTLLNSEMTQLKKWLK